MIDKSSPYGSCPRCGSPGEMRERRPNGNDICKNGHEYPSRNAVHGELKTEKVQALTHWWQGPCTCSICGYRCVSVIEISKEHKSPIVAMECGGCGGMTLHPDD